MTHVYTPTTEKSHGKSQTFETQRQTQQAQAPAAAGPEDRYLSIAKAAYLRAENRGFLPGCELQDWLEAEADVDELLTRFS